VWSVYSARFSQHQLQRREGRPTKLAYFIRWPGEQSPRKAVGLFGPGPTGGPKVPRHQRSDEVPACMEETVATE